MTVTTFLAIAAVAVLPFGLAIWARAIGRSRYSEPRHPAQASGAIAQDLDPLRREIVALREEMNRFAAQRPGAAMGEAEQRIAAVLAALDRGLPASIIADRHSMTLDQVQVIAACHRADVSA